jgi:hypothetical protein
MSDFSENSESVLSESNALVATKTQKNRPGQIIGSQMDFFKISSTAENNSYRKPKKLFSKSVNVDKYHLLLINLVYHRKINSSEVGISKWIFWVNFKGTLADNFLSSGKLFFGAKNTQKTMSSNSRQPKHTPYVFKNRSNPKCYSY